MSDIATTESLCNADFDRIELAEVRLCRGEQGTEYVSGRIIDRWEDDLTLRYRGHEHEVEQASEWELLRYQPVTSIEKPMIRSEWDDE